LEKVVSNVKTIKTLDVNEAKQKWLVQDFVSTNIYLTHIKRFISPSIKNNHAKILYDNMCGVGVVGLKPLAEELCIHQFDIVHGEHDAFFSFNLPNPTEAMLSGDFRQRVLDGHYDFGLATDSDGDRLGVIDEKGNYVSNNEILASLYYYLVKYKNMKGDIVKNCATSLLVDEVAAKLGYKCHEVDVGFKNITAKMKEVDALIGGESSGGLTVRGYLFGKDSVFSSALFMEMVILLQKPVSEIVADVKKFAGYHYSFLEDSLAFTTQSQPLIDYIDKHHPTFSRKLVRCDHFTRNFKFYFENDCWLLIRLSGTEPTFRIFAEMESDQEAVKCVRELKDYLEQVEMIIGGGNNP
jgi:phosphomannomutase